MDLNFNSKELSLSFNISQWREWRDNKKHPFSNLYVIIPEEDEELISLYYSIEETLPTHLRIVDSCVRTQTPIIDNKVKNEIMIIENNEKCFEDVIEKLNIFINLYEIANDTSITILSCNINNCPFENQYSEILTEKFNRKIKYNPELCTNRKIRSIKSDKKDRNGEGDRNDEGVEYDEIKSSIDKYLSVLDNFSRWDRKYVKALTDKKKGHIKILEVITKFYCSDEYVIKLHIKKK